MAPPKGKWNIALTQLTIELISQFTVIYLDSESKLTITFCFLASQFHSKFLTINVIDYGLALLLVGVIMRPPKVK